MTDEVYFTKMGISDVVNVGLTSKTHDCPWSVTRFFALLLSSLIATIIINDFYSDSFT